MPAAASAKRKYLSIHEAVRNGDVDEIISMVKAGASINEVEQENKFTPLHWAAHSGALECMHWLLWHGADTTVVTPRGWTPAHIAAIRGHDACMQALVNNGVSMCTQDTRGANPVHMAAAHGNSFTLQTILRTGVDANIADQNGWTAAHYACFHGRLGCLQLLVRWGSAMDDTDKDGNTPGHLSAMEGHLPCLKFLVASAPSATHVVGAVNDQGETPKNLAQQFYKHHVVEYIEGIEWERDHPEEAENLAFPAHIAAYQGDLEHLKMLVDNGIVNINERDDKGSTPSHKAAGQGNLAVLEWLIEMGANMTINNSAGETPKDVAARFAQLAAVKMLKGVTVDDDEDREAAPGQIAQLAHEGEDSDDEFSGPTVGNTEGESITMTDQQIKQARGRARKKIDDLERLVEIAKNNFRQLGGKLQEDRQKAREIREADSGSIASIPSEPSLTLKQDLEGKHLETINELTDQLEYERLRREKLEALLDNYKREINHLNRVLDEQPHPPVSDEDEIPISRKQRARSRQGKKSQMKQQYAASRSEEDNSDQIRRNYTVPRARSSRMRPIV